MVLFQSVELLIRGPLLSPIMGYHILGDFEVCAQEPAVRFNIQPATQSSGFSDVQINEASSSSHSTVALSVCPTVFSR